MSDHKFESLEDFLDGWSTAVEAGQSSISREEAIKRYYKYYAEDNDV